MKTSTPNSTRDRSLSPKVITKLARNSSISTHSIKKTKEMFLWLTFELIINQSES